MTPEEIVEVKVLMLDTWQQVGSWPDGTWGVWEEKLERLTVDEALRGIDHLARQGDAFPPGWGQVWRAAVDHGGARARFARERTRRRLAER